MFGGVVVEEGVEAGDGRIVSSSTAGRVVGCCVLSSTVRGSSTRFGIWRSSDADFSRSGGVRKAGSGGGLIHRNFGGCGVYVGSVVGFWLRFGGVRSACASVVCCVGICEVNYFGLVMGIRRLSIMLDKFCGHVVLSVAREV